MNDIARLSAAIKKFRDARDWAQFHTPKNLAISVAVEAAELLEHFQWLRDDELPRYIQENHEPLSDEIADVAMYLFALADDLKIDIPQAVHRKMRLNAGKYPVKKSRGSALKSHRL
ncbi:MAG: nucleotide pyrophosphohydrolase [Candidatus Omnitrophica bacterium]|nr:nucleotide pyrophosphohydrolase [Candidatus Omnitrophota bacterium]